jgi:hypothetical protein
MTCYSCTTIKQANSYKLFLKDIESFYQSDDCGYLHEQRDMITDLIAVLPIEKYKTKLSNIVRILGEPLENRVLDKDRLCSIFCIYTGKCKNEHDQPHSVLYVYSSIKTGYITDASKGTYEPPD